MKTRQTASRPAPNKPAKLRPRIMWAWPAHIHAGMIMLSRRKYTNHRESMVRVAVVPLHDVEQLASDLALEYITSYASTPDDKMLEALIAIGVLPKAKKRRGAK